MIFFEKIIFELVKKESEEFRNFQNMITRELSGNVSQQRASMESKMTEDEIYCSRLEHVPLCNPDNPLFPSYKHEFKKIDFYQEKHIWKKQYYSHFIPFDDDVHYNDVRTKMVMNYFESLVFTLRYYLKGCPSWSWYYRYRTSPIPSDMLTVLQKYKFDLNRVLFQQDKPNQPLEQLMFILPPQMRYLLPDCLKNCYMEYPMDFNVDALAGIKYIYSEAILPEVEIMRIDDSSLSQREKKRNTIHYKIFTNGRTFF
jgi:5'-3' exonuclease